MNIFPKGTRIIIAILICPIGRESFGAWQGMTVGQPIVENISAKDIGMDGYMWITLQDKLGRVFVGGNQLHVFDGQSWQSFSIPHTHSIKSLALGKAGQLWTGAFNEVGYYSEDTLGKFRYHSLIPQLPKNERNLGYIWGCAPVDNTAYFISTSKVLRWDGAAFKTWFFPTATRLYPLKLNDEFWVHHLETGLYRIDEAGPHLEVPACELPNGELLGLLQDSRGLLLVSANGLYRAGPLPIKISSEAVSNFLIDSRPFCSAVISDDLIAIGTVNKGIALVDKSGALLRTLDTTNGLPSRAVFAITPQSDGYAWCATPDGIFHIRFDEHSTLYGPANGLMGQVVVDLETDTSRLFTLTREGVYQLTPTDLRGGRFEKWPQMTVRYNDMQSFRGGLMLARHGGVDFFDGTNVRNILHLPTKTILYVKPSQVNDRWYYLALFPGLDRLDIQPDGSITHTQMVELPDACTTLHEESADKLWIGTPSKGGFICDPKSKDLRPVIDPANGKPMQGRVSISGDDRNIFIFNNGRIMMPTAKGTELRLLAGLPVMEFIAMQTLPDSQGYVLAMKHSNRAETLAQCVGLLQVTPSGEAKWQELDIPALDTLGFLRILKLFNEEHRPILWIGGSEGLLRLDYTAITKQHRPEIPRVRIDPARSSHISSASELAYPLAGHRLGLQVFTGDNPRSKTWLLQTRLGPGEDEWSAPTSRRSFEFSNLSVGEYRFEVRTINPAGMTSAPAAITFRILPPWYQAREALLGYCVILGLAALATLRFRERNIRRENQSLEKLVNIRTEELVRANTAKDEFLAGISHEIRNPMNGVVGIAESINTESMDPESQRKLGLLRQCAGHLSGLLEDILDYSRMQSGAIELEPNTFELRALLDSITAITAIESEKCEIPVVVSISPELPPILHGDERRIRQILLNFVGNALKYSGHGSVRVSVRGNITGADRREIIFAVADDGPGIPLAEQQRLFNRFERGAAAQERHVRGTGLGLALSKGLAQSMGGHIWLESNPGQGSTFYFSGPFARANPPNPEEPLAAFVQPVQEKFALVVDDEEYNCIAMTSMLEAMGYTVQCATDGCAALALAQSRFFNVIFLDYNLPGMSGPAICRIIRQPPSLSAGSTIIATTAFNTPEKRTECVSAGMNHFLAKPVTSERLRLLFSALQNPPALTVLAPASSTDPLASLRLLSSRKGTTMEKEIALYIAEFKIELERLNSAVLRQDAAQICYYAHLLYGRSVFIAERELEQSLRQIEIVGATGQWEQTRQLILHIMQQTNELELRLACV